MSPTEYAPASHSVAPRFPHEVLESLLMQAPYRDMWGQFVQRRRGRGVNIRAVATFMAYELSDAAGHEIAPEQYKDSIRRALKGEMLTDRTAMRFISAFGFNSQETDDLWRAIVHHRNMDKSIEAKANHEMRRSDPQRDYVTLSQTLALRINKDGLIRQFDFTEIVMAEHDGVRYLNPLFEGSDVDIEVIEGGIIKRITTDYEAGAENDQNDIFNLLIELPYPLFKGEIHRCQFRVHVHESIEDNPDFVNHIGTGASEREKFNITTMLIFEEPPPEIRHCFWDDNAYENPVVEEILAPGHRHYSMHYPVIHKAYCGFIWPIRRPDGVFGDLNLRSRTPLAGIAEG